MATLSRKHFIALAAACRPAYQALPATERALLVYNLCRFCQESNPRFDTERFVAALQEGQNRQTVQSGAKALYAVFGLWQVICWHILSKMNRTTL